MILRTFLLVWILSISAISFAQQTFVPDDNFEQALIDLGYDDVLDDYVLTSNIETVTLLDVDDLRIDDLTGIKDFAALQELYCSDNNLVELDVEGLSTLYGLYCYNNNLESLLIGENNVLYWLKCSNNNLTSIDVTLNPNLSELVIPGNNLTSLDISQNTNLAWLHISNNQISTLDLSNNPKLKKLNIEFNSFTELDVSSNIDLESLQCRANMIGSLDLSNNPLLTGIWCYDNNLSFLDIRNGNNYDIDFMNAQGNPDLTCIYVDDADYSTDNWEYVDSNSTFVETQEDCDLLSTSENTIELDIVIYPNPTNRYLYISVPQELVIKAVKIFDLAGRLIFESANVNTIDLQDKKGNFFLIAIETANGTFFKKIMKN